MHRATELINKSSSLNRMIPSQSLLQKLNTQQKRFYTGKHIKVGTDARILMLSIDKLTYPVALGPNGRNVIFGQSCGLPKIAKETLLCGKGASFFRRFSSNASNRKEQDVNTENFKDEVKRPVFHQEIRKSIFPLPSFGSNPIDLFTASNFFVDKTEFIEHLEGYNSSTFLALKPRRFGKTLFTNIIAEYYDILNEGNNFKTIFGNTYIGKHPTSKACTYMIFSIQFDGLQTSSVDVFIKSFSVRIIDAIDRFARRYEKKLGLALQKFKINESDPIGTFLSLLGFAHTSGYKVYFTIDEYDNSINTALDISIVNYLRVKGTAESTQRENVLNKAESIFKQFFSIIKLACDKYRASAFVTGVTPTEFTSGFNSAFDLHLNFRFRYMYGFIASDIMAGLNSIKPALSDNTKQVILNKWREDDDGYFFVKEQEEGIFNPTKIMYGLQYVQQRWADYKLDDPNFLLLYPPDQNTLPAENTLHIISSQPLGRQIINTILQNGIYVRNEPIHGRFRITTIGKELLTIPDSLLSFLYYTGALTYQQNSYNLKITNNTAKKEFFDEFCKIAFFKVQNITDYDLAVKKLLNNRDISDLCKLVSKIQLTSLQNNNVVNNKEDGLCQAFYDAFIFTLLSKTNIQREYKVDIAKRDLNEPGDATDLIIKKPYGTPIIIIEFKNIQISQLKNYSYTTLNDNGGEIKIINPIINFTWEQLTDVSEKIAARKDSEVLEQQLVYPNMGKTVNDYYVKGQNQLKGYKDKLEKEIKQELSAFLVLRVGLTKLIFMNVK